MPFTKAERVRVASLGVGALGILGCTACLALDRIPPMMGQPQDWDGGRSHVAVLERRVTVKAEKIPADQVFAFVQAYDWHRCQDKAKVVTFVYRRPDRVTLDVADASILTVVEKICEQLDLALRIEGRTVVIAQDLSPLDRVKLPESGSPEPGFVAKLDSIALPRFDVEGANLFQIARFFSALRTGCGCAAPRPLARPCRILTCFRKLEKRCGS